ncbi:PREDICTED: guanine nucleotide-releasing factor 2-like [Priapulus caudatus]|uniref:Guanine nucleotide-releasing factor 2-like n=1 Tax=Priapulus caudatus TaxID=37621 RepID=A0ABM1DR92_PRICU|nr:PREDICTED: guanine nucleotide-releasing factor 2-like [Priapulus caudatus]
MVDCRELGGIVAVRCAALSLLPLQNLVQLHADRIQDRSTQREPPLELPEVGGMRSKEPESDSNTSLCASACCLSAMTGNWYATHHTKRSRTWYESSSGAADDAAGKQPARPVVAVCGNALDKPSMKLARRARSFKDDVMDRINNMRVSPGGATLRSPSPTKHVKTSPLGGVACMETNLQKDDKEMDKLYLCKKDVLYALKYFQDVIEKSMMQLLPGSATIVLETVTAVFSVLGHTNDDSSVIISSHNQVFQSIAQFIHFADHMLLHDEVPADRERANQVIRARRHEDGAPDAAADGSEPAPPPLPIKKRNIMAYMQMVGDYAVPNRDELLQLNWRTSHSLMRHIAATPALQQLQPPRWPAWSSHSLPPLMTSSSDDSGMFSLDLSLPEDDAPPPALPPKQRHLAIEEGRAEELAAREAEREHGEERTKEAGGKEGVAEEEPEGEAADAAATHALEALDPGLYLVWKKEREEGPDVRGGTVDGLIVLAACRAKNQNDFLYQEAFLTTYRTFMGSRPLIDKLLHRYRAFSRCADTGRKRSSRSAFSLLVRVVDELCVTDVDDSLVKILTDLVFELLSDGQLLLGKVLRSRILEKCETKRESSNHHMLLLPSIAVSSRPVTLLDYKPEHIAEQMTMLDASLFQKMEIAEMLLWAKEQSEELSPNLTLFTEHFNKMSYWARSRILEQDDARDRERHLVRFIKIMKHLRRLNNFNSYLALLSALDSAPIRRLDWVKQITETLKEYCELIDSSASFRAYRLALAETEPPCIPYIGLILQDLTFVHIGNSDLLPDGKINFAKRWQQFNILDNMRKFRMCNYPIKKNERILAFFNGFSDYLDEETMWQISESIKPRGGRSKQTHM